LAKELPSDFEAPAAMPTATCVPLRILLAEDNPANQKLATYVLQDRGHLVEIAGDGQEAVSLTERNRYDVILMDVQMPGMNGLEATAAIRAAEQGTGAMLRNGPEGASHSLNPSPVPPGDGRRRVPIIAMTAHAAKGDRDRCLAAGMDGYLSKPIDGSEMISLVETLAARPPAVAPVPPADKAAEPPAAPAFDPELALKRCLNKPSMLAEMIRCFYAEADSLLPEMRAALAQGNLPEVGHLGHRLKGTVVYLGAQPVQEAALRVERFCQSSSGTPSEAEDAVNGLEHACIVLKAALRDHPLAVGPKQGDFH
jgi:two-component system, sensor histidine kinase and response regulator